ncbi:MAG: LysM peptidoglycan-binding domain-containing protein [Thermoflexales bacterium]
MKTSHGNALGRMAALILAAAALTACIPSASAGIPTPVSSGSGVLPQAVATLRPATPLDVLPTATPVPPPAPAPTAIPAVAPTPLPTAVPAPVPAVPVPVPAAPPAAPNPGYVYGGGGCRNTTYVVQRGDNLFRIALRYGTSVASIARLNGISNSALIYTGRRLSIYACGQWSGGRVYVVQPGDTLYRIAVRFGTTVQAIQLANRLTSSFIASGWTLAIP